MSDTVSETAGKILWFELPAEDAARARGFYGQLFGWQFQPFDESGEYQTTAEGGGAVYPSSDGEKGLFAYFGVADIDAAVGRVRQLGGEAADSREIPGVGHYSRCSDTEGNAFGLYQPGG